MNIAKITIPLGQIYKNTERLLVLAWNMDRRTTKLYYLTAAIGALVTLASAYALKVLIDYLQLTQQSLMPTVPIIIAAILAGRYLITLLDGVIYGGLHQSFLDYVHRYELQNEITMKFHQKIAKMDIKNSANARRKSGSR